MIIAAICAFYLDASLAPINIKQSLSTSDCLYCTITSNAMISYPITGLIIAPIIIFLLIPLASKELTALFNAKNINAHRSIITITSMATCLAIFLAPALSTNPATTPAIVITVLVAAYTLTLLVHCRDTNPNGAIAAAGATALATILLGIMPAFLLLMRQQHSAWVILAVILITKSCDIGAFFTGRFLGKHKLIHWLSPKKTWEGLAGGVTFAALIAILFAYLSRNTHLADTLTIVNNQIIYNTPQYSLPFAALIGIILALVGQLGDLMVSLFKRDANAKDSGTSIPGFGGVLDVFDSLLLIAPVAYWLLLPTLH